MSHYIAVTGITPDGKVKYSIDPLTYTTDKEQAYKWDNLDLCKSDVKALKKVYGIKADIYKVGKLGSLTKV